MKRILLALVALVPITLSGYSQIIRVPLDQPSVQAGIDSASAGDTVLVDEGTYLENINFHGKAITLASHFLLDGDTSHISRTILDGSQPEDPDTASTVTMLRARDTTTVLCGFTITGGSGTGEFETVFPGVYTRNGGGIFNAGGKIVNNIIRDNHVTHNQVAAGGGLNAGNTLLIPADTGINLVIRNNIFYHNSCSTQVHYAQGGGMALSLTNGITLVENNQIHHNTTHCEDPYKAMSGGMAVGKPTSNTGKGIIRNNHFHHNEAHSLVSFGGGIFYILFADLISEEFSPTHFYNNIIDSNYSENCGGGISIWYLGYWDFPPSVDPIIYNNTIVGNSSKKGNGISIVDAEVVMFNNILWNNSTNETGEEMFTDVFRYCPGYSPQWCFDQNKAKLHSKFNIVKGGYPGTGNIDVFPLFDSASFEPSEGSPSIGHGVDSVEIDDSWYYALIHDFYGNPRPNPIDNRVDLGAIESPFKGYVYIPDTAFLYALIEEGVDINGDSLISYGEAEAVISLDVHGFARWSISDLTGIDAFVNLDTLQCGFNRLTTLDVSNNTALTVLDCIGNQLTTLDVSNNTAITSLGCRGNQITSLDLSKNTALAELNVSFNDLTSLYLANNNTLFHLECTNNQLSSLDVSNEDALAYLDCGYNHLTSLDISTNIDLKELCLGNMPTLYEVCIWETFNPDSISIDTSESPNVCFQTDCNGDCSIVGVGESCPQEVVIYPNPTGDLLNIETVTSDQYSINITSLNGQIILSRDFEGTTHQLDLSSFEKGIYFVTLRTQNSIIIKKIIKL